jgi:hypothetical protein
MPSEGLKGLKLEKVEVLMNKNGLEEDSRRAQEVDVPQKEAKGAFRSHRETLKNLQQRPKFFRLLIGTNRTGLHHKKAPREVK